MNDGDDDEDTASRDPDAAYEDDEVTLQNHDTLVLLSYNRDPTTIHDSPTSEPRFYSYDEDDLLEQSV